MFPGFIPGSRASFMMDLVVLVMMGVVPVMTWSLYLVRVKRAYRAHKLLQLSIGAALLVTVLAFEVDVRLSDWRQAATASPYYDTVLFPFLYVHLFFAVNTFLLWLVTLGWAIKKMPKPPRPGAHSRWHRVFGRLTALGTYSTAMTGWIFYWLAFIAS